MQLGSPGGSDHHPIVGSEDRARVVDRHRVFSFLKTALESFPQCAVAGDASDQKD